MTTTVFVAVLAAAVLHAGWNAFLKLEIEPLLVMLLMAVCSAAVGAVMLIVVGLPLRGTDIKEISRHDTSPLSRIVYTFRQPRYHRGRFFGVRCPFNSSSAKLSESIVAMTDVPKF